MSAVEPLSVDASSPSAAPLSMDASSPSAMPLSMDPLSPAATPPADIIVCKFGGTSVATAQRMQAAARRLVQYHQQGRQVVAVVSAMGHTTDDLTALALSVNPNPPSRELDRLLGTGEQASMAVLAMAIEALGVPAVSLSGRQAGILATTVYSHAQIAEVNAERIQAELNRQRIVVVAGFQGITSGGDIATLGRGGSDTTAVAIAAALPADLCEIYSDVDGIYSADPRLVSTARKLETISYEEMLELASAGAGVLQSRAVEVARNFGVTVCCRNAFNDRAGTIIRGDSEMEMEAPIVTGIACDHTESKVTIRGVPDRVGIAAELFSAIAGADVNVDMIVQNISEGGTTDISFTVPTSELSRLRPVLDELVDRLGIRGYLTAGQVAKVSLVGAGMKSNPGVAAQMFKVLAEHSINIDMISTSGIRISVVIDAERMTEAAQALHTAFGLDSAQIFEDTQLSAAEQRAKLQKGR